MLRSQSPTRSNRIIDSISPAAASPGPGDSAHSRRRRRTAGCRGCRPPRTAGRHAPPRRRTGRNRDRRAVERASAQGTRELEHDGDAGGAVVRAHEAGDVLRVVVRGQHDRVRLAARDRRHDVARTAAGPARPPPRLRAARRPGTPPGGGSRAIPPGAARSRPGPRRSAKARSASKPSAEGGAGDSSSSPHAPTSAASARMATIAATSERNQAARRRRVGFGLAHQ